MHPKNIFDFDEKIYQNMKVLLDIDTNLMKNFSRLFVKYKKNKAILAIET